MIIRCERLIDDIHQNILKYNKREIIINYITIWNDKNN